MLVLTTAAAASVAGHWLASAGVVLASATVCQAVNQCHNVGTMEAAEHKTDELAETNSMPGDDSIVSVPASILSGAARSLRRLFSDMPGARRLGGTSDSKDTRTWRRLHDIDALLHKHLPYARQVKAAVPFWLHGVDREGNLVVYVRPSASQLDTLFTNGCTKFHVAQYYAFWLEYARRRVKTQSVQRGLHFVYDIAQTQRAHLFSPPATTCYNAVEKIMQHYSGLVLKVSIINAPIWFAALWPAAKRAVPAHISAAVVPCSRTPVYLSGCVAADQLPKCYGGSSMLELGQDPVERGLLDLLRHNAHLVESPKAKNPDDLHSCGDTAFSSEVDSDADDVTVPRVLSCPQKRKIVGHVRDVTAKMAGSIGRSATRLRFVRRRRRLRAGRGTF